MTQELERAVRAFRLEQGDVRQVLLNGFKAAFVPFRERGQLMAGAVQEIDSVFASARAPSDHPERELL
jgi:adenosine deaminase